MNLKELTDEANELEYHLPAPVAAGLTTGEPINRLIDHTLLKPEATPEQVDAHCAVALQHQFAAVCVNTLFTAQIVDRLKGSLVAPCGLAGFPSGAVPAQTKAYEARYAIQVGAREIDMTIAVGLLKSGKLQDVYEDITAVVAPAKAAGVLVKVILETCLLTRREKILACLLCKAAGADFVKTSTGLLSGGATVADVQLMRGVVGPQMGVKASGGIRSLADALAMIHAGASRLGTSSGSKIIQEYQALQVP